jgi:hypothetical protein
MTILTSKLDAPQQILGVRVSTIVIILGSLLAGALMDVFLIGLLTLAGVLYLRRKIEKMAKFTVQRFIYRSLPTRAKLYGGQFDAMVESYKTEWCK